MAQAGYTPISLYYSTTAAAVPTAGNLVAGELAINIADGKLYYENSSGVVTLLAGAGGAGIVAGSNTQLQFNNSGVFGASANLTWDGTTLSSTQVNITGQGTLRLQDTTGGEYVALRAPASLAGNYTLTFPADDGTSGQALITDGSGVLSWSTAASGDVYGPASATNNGIVLFDSTTGKLIKDSAASDGLIYGLTVGRGASAVSTNTVVGYQAGLNQTASSGFNSLFGYQTGLNITSGTVNTAFGRGSIGVSSAAVTGSNNTAIGNFCLAVLTSGSDNFAGGVETLRFTTTGNYNIAVGSGALRSNTTASNNTAVGYQAAYVNTTGADIVAVGYQALDSNTTGGFNTAVGSSALASNTTSTENTAVGYRSLSTTTGAQNTAVGSNSAYFNTTGTGLTAIGNYALYQNTTGNSNTAVGANDASTTAALQANTTGARNTAVGVGALTANTTASNNVAVGYQAGLTNITGTGVTAIGYQALQFSTGNYNTAIGRSAGLATTTGVSNFFGGVNAGGINTTGSNNTVVGGLDGGLGAAFQNNTTGSNNVAFGSAALFSNTTASNNTAVGYQAGYSNTTATNTTVLGYTAGRGITTGNDNVMLGANAGYVTSTGTGNVYIGSSACYNTTGTQNIGIGYNVSTANAADGFSIILSTRQAAGKGASTGYIDPNGGGVYQGNNASTWSTTSDQRLKKNIVDNNTGLEKITAIQVRNFEYRLPEEITDVAQNQAIKKQGVQLGVIAQELQQVLPECVKTESTGVMTVDADNLTWYLVNAVKELSAQVAQLQSQLKGN